MPSLPSSFNLSLLLSKAKNSTNKSSSNNTDSTSSINSNDSISSYDTNESNSSKGSFFEQRDTIVSASVFALALATLFSPSADPVRLTCTTLIGSLSLVLLNSAFEDLNPESSSYLSNLLSRLQKQPLKLAAQRELIVEADSSEQQQFISEQQQFLSEESVEDTSSSEQSGELLFADQEFVEGERLEL